MKLFFDNTFGRPLVIYLRELVEKWHKPPNPTIQHLQERFAPDTKDSVWVPDLAGHYFMIVSGDRGRNKPRLHEVCREQSLRLIVISGAILQTGNFEWLRAMLAAWPQLMQAYGAQIKRHRMVYSRNRFHVIVKEHPYA